MKEKRNAVAEVSCPTLLKADCLVGVPENNFAHQCYILLLPDANKVETMHSAQTTLPALHLKIHRNVVGSFLPAIHHTQSECWKNSTITLLRATSSCVSQSP